MSKDLSSDSGLGRDRLPQLTESIALYQQARRGDQAALGDLLERCRERLERIVRVRLGPSLRPHVGIDDIVQETFEVAVRKIGGLEIRSTASILQWLSRIAENKIRDANDYLTAQKRDRRRERGLESSGDTVSPRRSRQLVADDTLPEDRAWRRELMTILDEGLSQLPDDYREVILLRDYCAGSWEFVAQELGRPTKAAAQELHRRAWGKLRKVVLPRLDGLT